MRKGEVWQINLGELPDRILDQLIQRVTLVLTA
jgi:hypothetical protein